MKNYLLVHGAYHGAWCWEQVKKYLEKKGNSVYAIDLPGHGQDHAPRNEVNITSCVKSVKDFIEKNNLQNLILVGHSLGGVVISKLLEEVPARIHKLVFLSGVILDDGEAFFDYLPENIKELYDQQAAQSEDNAIPPSQDSLKARLFNNLPKSISFGEIRRKLTPQPIGSYKEKIFIKNFKQSKTPMVYVLPSKDISLPREVFEKMLSRLPRSYKKISIDSDHEVMFSRPKELAEILNNL